MVEVFMKVGKSKRGKWSSPLQFIEIDGDADYVTVPGTSGKTMFAAVEYNPSALHEN